MTRRARWIGVGAGDMPALLARCASLAQSQPVNAEPIVLCGIAPAELCLGRELGMVWVDAGQQWFVMIVPARIAPGRARRWIAWALAPAIATCRSFGVQAYVEGHELWVAGRSIAAAGCSGIGGCAVIGASLPRALAEPRLLASRLRGAIEAQFGWQFETSWPSALERRAMAEVA